MKITRKSLLALSTLSVGLVAGAALAAQEIRLSRYDSVEFCFPNRYTESGYDTVKIEGKILRVDALARASVLESMHDTLDGNNGCVKASVTGYVAIERGQEVFKLIDASQE